MKPADRRRGRLHDLLRRAEDPDELIEDRPPTPTHTRLRSARGRPRQDDKPNHIPVPKRSHQQ